MKQIIFGILFITFSFFMYAQSSVSKIEGMRQELQNAADPFALVKQKWKKKFKIDTIVITSTSIFYNLADSLAYSGKERKVYGPFESDSILVMILKKFPNKFYHVSHILLDTGSFKIKFANKLADSFLVALKKNTLSFDNLARTYNIDGTANQGGEMGWIARGMLIPEIDRQLAIHKKGDIFKVKTKGGIHIIKMNQAPKTDTGFALLMRVFL